MCFVEQKRQLNDLFTDIIRPLRAVNDNGVGGINSDKELSS